MEEVEQPKSFGIADFVVLIGLLLVSIIIGIYYAIKDKKDKTMETYNFGGRKMSPIPLGLSISATFISAVTFIAFPAETYLFGTVLWWFAFASFIPTSVMCAYYIPVMHRLQISSLFEFFELRFDHRMRKVGSVLGCVIMVLIMASTVYIPGIALSAVTPLGSTTTILLTSGICTFYTMLGGMKAVVWTDFFQTFVMLAGSIAVLIKVAILVGGFGNAWTIAEQGGRLNFFNFDPDPRIRNTFWTIICGCAVTWSNPNQAIIQRYLSCESVSKARKAAVVAVFPNIIFASIAMCSGVLMYVYYHDCDPLMSNKVEKVDQLMPYLVVDIFQDLPGMAGLFVSAGFSGTLSTVSSGINSLAALIMEDFVIPLWPKLSQTGRVTISKGIVVGFGVIVTIFAIIIQYINGTIMQIGYTFAGTIGGGMCGVFTLGLFFPWTNTKGAFVGQIVGTGFTTWIAMCGLLYGKSPVNQALPLSTDGCSTASGGFNISLPVSTSTMMEDTFTTYTSIANPESDGLAGTLYAISYLYYSAIATLVTVLAGLFVSFLTGANKPFEADPKLFVPFVSHSIFPAKVRQFFRFGVPDLQEKNVSERKFSTDSSEKDWMIESTSSDKFSSKHDEMIETNI